ncbi:GntR family transcriptional regulator [Jiulongibacter sp. NS-SX5]|uniref:GntR family transcriptional regulator n=1 Tax=Jiulongibacter sp. NS-SX5 TaxID=3463854 RepID=UPI00405A4028
MTAKINYKDLSIQAYEVLREEIITGKLAPGEKLIQEKLAERLGLSRMPLHRAFQMLQDEMLVEAKPRRGFYVREQSKKSLLDAFLCREVLDGLAARTLAQNSSHKSIAKDLKKIFQAFLEQKDINEKAYRKADEVFHNTLVELSENQMLIRMNNMGQFLRQSYVFGLVRPPQETLTEHLAIIQAIEDGNTERAEQEIKNHARKSIETLEVESADH